MKRLAKIVNGFQPLTIFAKRSILDIWQSSEYSSENITAITSTSSPEQFLKNSLPKFLSFLL